MTQSLPALVFMVPLTAAVAMPVVGHWKRSACRPLTVAATIAMAVLAAASLFSVGTFGPVRYALGGWQAPLGIEWIADEVSATMAAIASVVGLLVLGFSGALGEASLSGRTVPYHSTVLLLLAGVVGVIYAGDLFNIFVFLEVVSLAAYALVAVPGGRALLSAFRYLMIGALATTFYLLGVAYFYALTGTLNIADLAQRLPGLLESKAAVGGIAFILIGLAIKMALLPVHAWLPDAYADAPDSAAPLLAALVTKAAILVWARILLWGIIPANADAEQILYAIVSGLGIVASVGGALLAMRQTEIKRIFAYGGIAHIGLVMVGLGQASAKAAAGALYYLVNDAVMQAGLFIFAGVVAWRYRVRAVDDITGAGIRNPWVVAPLVIAAVGMVGIPPTGGFVGKWNILLGTMEAGNPFAAAALVLTTLLTLAYFAPVLERIFRSQRMSRMGEPRGELGWPVRLSMAVPAALVLGLGIFGDGLMSAFLRVVGGP